MDNIDSKLVTNGHYLGKFNILVSDSPLTEFLNSTKKDFVVISHLSFAFCLYRKNAQK